MKKTIATISLAMVMGFGMALVHADDSMSNTTGNTNTTANAPADTNSVQQPGTVGGTNDTTAAPSDQMAAPDTTKSTDTTTTSKSAMKSKSCTDDTGKVLHKGQTGYKDCMKNMKDQMGGTVDQTKTEIHKHTDSANPSDMNSAPAQGTGSDSTSH